MLYHSIKLVISAVLIVAISELAKRQPVLAGASLPLVSLLAIVWLYVDTRDGALVAELSLSIFWLVIPSLLFFLALPLLLRQGFGFTWSFTLAIVTMLAAYRLMLLGLRAIGIRII